MRIVFYNACQVWSGGARAFAAAAHGLGARGHHVAVVCPPDSSVEQRLTADTYEVVPAGSSHPGAQTVRRLRQMLADHMAEVLFLHTEREQIVAAAAVRLAGRGTIVRRIGHDAPSQLGRGGRLALRLAATGLLFGSDEELRLAPAARAADFGPLVAPLGIPGQAYDPARLRARAATGVPGGEGGGGSASKLIVCVCDLQSRLRAAVALRVMALLAARHPDLRMALLGPGSDTEELRMHAAALGTTKLVSFLGERDDYLSVFGGADLGWVVARGDDAAFALLELQALRVPVLAERGVVTRQYVADGITGLLLPSDDVPATAAAVARMLAQDDQRAAMGQAARARVLRDFSEAIMVDKFEQAALVATGGRSQR